MATPTEGGLCRSDEGSQTQIVIVIPARALAEGQARNSSITGVEPGKKSIRVKLRAHAAKYRHVFLSTP
jgi:hypothetical protein